MNVALEKSYFKIYIFKTDLKGFLYLWLNKKISLNGLVIKDNRINGITYSRQNLYINRFKYLIGGIQ